MTDTVEAVSEAAKWLACGVDCCCGHSDRAKVVLAITAILLGILDIVTDWVAFGVFAASGFRTSPLGDSNTVLLYLWIAVIGPGTIMGLIDLVAKIVFLKSTAAEYNVKKKADTNEEDKVELQPMGGAVDVNSRKKSGNQLVSTDTNSKRDLIFTSCKVIFEDGSSAILGWYLLSIVCHIKLSPSSGESAKVESWLLLVSWISSSLSAFVCVIQITYAVRGKWCRLDCDQKYSKHQCIYRIARISTTLVAGICGGLAIIGIVTYSLAGTGAGLFPEREATVYLQTNSDHDASTDSFRDTHQFVANFSDIYSSGNEGVKRYVDRRQLGCYEYHLKFDKNARVVLFNQAVFLPDGLKNVSQLKTDQISSLRTGNSSTCHPCLERDNSYGQTSSGGEPRICKDQSAKLVVYFYEGNQPIDNNYYCIGKESRLAKYNSSITICQGTSSRECYKNAPYNFN